MKKVVSIVCVVVLFGLCLNNFGMKKRKNISEESVSKKKKENNNIDEDLFDAIQLKDYDKVEKAISEGADVNYLYKDKVTPLHIAAQLGSDKIVILLIKNKADVNAQNFEQQAPIHAAEKFETFKILLKVDGVDINIQDDEGLTPLHYAVQDRKSEKIKLLLAMKNIDVNVEGKTPLYWASQAGEKSIVQMLLGAGANVNIKDKDGDAPLDIAMEKAYYDIVELLIDNDSSFDTAMATDLLYVVIDENVSPQFIKKLLDAGALLIPERKNIGLELTGKKVLLGSIDYSIPQEETILERAINAYGLDSEIVKIIVKKIKEYGEEYKKTVNKTRK